MDHMFRFQRSMHVKLTPVLRDGGQIQPLESVIMILVKKPGNLVRQEGNNVVFSQFASISMQNGFMPQSVVAVYATTLRLCHHPPDNAPNVCVPWHAPRYSL